jgi:capsular polysaccharide transport system permease protein
MTGSRQTAAHLPPPLRIRRSARSRGLRVVGALILREMSSTYGRSPGGYVWAVLEPVLAIAVFAVVFSLVLRAPSLGTNFLLFYASGVLPLRFFQQLSRNVGGAISFNRPLLGYPRVMILDTILARAALAVLTQFMVATIVVAGLIATQDLREHIDFGPVLEALALCLLLGLGIGTLNAFLTLRFPVWDSFWSMASRPLILISGVFYIYEDLPPLAQDVLWFNPLLHITALVRAGVYSTYRPDWVSGEYVIVLALVPMVFGLMLLRSFGRDLLTR